MYFILFCSILFYFILFYLLIDLFIFFIYLLSIKHLCGYININNAPTNQEAGKEYTDVNHAHLSHTSKSPVR